MKSLTIVLEILQKEGDEPFVIARSAQGQPLQLLDFEDLPFSLVDFTRSIFDHLNKK